MQLANDAARLQRFRQPTVRHCAARDFEDNLVGIIDGRLPGGRTRPIFANRREQGGVDYAEEDDRAGRLIYEGVLREVVKFRTGGGEIAGVGLDEFFVFRDVAYLSWELEGHGDLRG
jgi:hypothetical protein